MAETIWTIIALLGAIGVGGVIAYLIEAGRHARDDDEDAAEHRDDGPDGGDHALTS